MTENGRQAISEAAIYTAVQAMKYCPVDTGHLRSTIKVLHSNMGDLSTVVVDATYAVPVEFGHVTRSGGFVPPQPFLRMAIVDASEAWPNIVHNTWAGNTSGPGNLGTEVM